MSVDAQLTGEIQVEHIADFAQFINGSQAPVGHVTSLVQGSDVGTSILQVQDGTIIQVSEQSATPIVQVTDQAQPVYLTEGLPNGFQVLDTSSFPFVQNSDGSIIQLAPSMLGATGSEGLTQVVQFANGQIAYIEQQENIDPQNVQHYVLEQVAGQPTIVQDGVEIQQQQLMEAVVPEHAAPVKLEPGLEQTKPPIGKGPFTCEICEKVCEKWPQYQRHLRSHEEDKPFRCFQCPESFNIADNLKLHLATHVKPGDKPQCPECKKKFSRVASLKAHIMMHEKEEILMCQECGDEFGLQSQLDRHMIEHRQDKDGTRVYSCRQCNAQYPSQKLLKEHTKQHFKVKSSLSHRSYNREIDRSSFSHKCSHCMKSFQKPSQMHRHMRIHTGDRPFKCSICNKAFNQKGALQIHMLGRHTDKRPHTCQFCDVGFSQKGNLRAHIQRVHTLTEDTTGTGETVVFSCTECSCVFRKLGSLNAHISRFHTEEDPTRPTKKRALDDGDAADDVIQQLLELSETGIHTTSHQGQEIANCRTADDILEQALQNSGLPGGNNAKTSHSIPGGILSTMNVRDTATGAIKKHYIRKIGNITWHQCTFCTKEFKKPSDLVRHSRIHSHEKPYKCTQCFRAFAVKSTLNSHIRTHTGIKQFKCNVCDKNFSTHGSLKVHLRLHTGAKPFDCPHCDKKFRTAAHRKSHIIAHFKSPDKAGFRSKDGLYKRSANKDVNLPDVPLQEPILITDTGLIQQPPRSTIFNQYLGESGSVDRPYKCQYCQRGFKKSSHLKQHVRSHTGEKPYKCLTCLRTFVSNGVLKAHIRIHTGMKQYKCLMCDNMFSTNGSLKRHMSTHSDVRPFMCPYCQRTFKTNVNCKKHMKTHRHELAIQSMSQQGHNPNVLEGSEIGVSGEVELQQHGGEVQLPHGGGGGEYIEEETVDNDLSLVQHELQTTPITQQTDLTQQSILTQSGLHDALGLTGTHIEQQILNQQMFGQQQTFTQSLLGTGQQNFQQMNNQMAVINQQQGHFALQQQQQQQIPQLDINQFTNPPVLQQPGTQTIHTIQGVVSNISGAGDQQMTVTNISNVQHDGQQIQGMSSGGEVSTDGQIHAGQLVNTAALPSTNMDNILDTRDDEEEDVCEEDDRDVTTEPAQGGVYSEDGRKIYPCDLCDKVYKKTSHLKQHRRSHTGEKPYRCSRCNKTFVSMGVLRQHLRTHTGIKEYKCSACNAMFTTNGSLTRHMNIHVSIKPYKCPFCLEPFRTAAICKRHMKTHQPEGEHDDDDDDGDEDYVPRHKNLKTKLVDLPDNIATHVQEAGVDMGLSERILIESASEKERVSEVKELSVQQEEKHAHQCDHCNKSFKKPSDLVRHNRIHTGEKPFACGICGRMFTVKSTLDSHLKTHGGYEKTIKCHVCNSLFSTKGSLKVHMRLHTGAKPFRCPHCPQRFRTSGHRKSHIMSHYSRGGTNMRKNKKILNLYDQPTEQPAAQNQISEYLNINPVEAQNVQQILNQSQVGQVINIDQSMIQGNNVLPMSITVDNFGNFTESALAAQVLQGIEGLQLHLAGGIPGGQGIQITGLDPSMFNQTLQIDANLLQQIQAGNVNLAINPQQTTDNNIVQGTLGNSNLQIQPISIQEGINPNLVVQPPTTLNTTGSQPILEPHIGMSQETGPSSFVVAADGSISTDQQTQVVEMPAETTAESLTLNTNLDHVAIDNLSSGHGDIHINNNNANLSEAGLDNGEGGVMSVVNSNIMGVTDDHHGDMGVANTLHGVRNDDLDPESSEMTAIDPNMTNNMGDMLEDNNDSDDDVGADDDDLDDSDIIHETVGDDIPEHFHDNTLIQGEDGDESYTQTTQDTSTVFGTRSHKCNVCFKMFKRQSHLKEHLRIHTKGEESPTKDKTAALHKCPYCTKCFQKPSQLDRHIRVHTGERPFVCNICRKAFNQKNALQMHLKKHTGVKPHKCNYCEMAFTQKGNLKTHIKRAHHSDMVSSMNIPDGFPATSKETNHPMDGEEDLGQQHGKYVHGDDVEESGDSGNQVVNQDLNLVEVADLLM